MEVRHLDGAARLLDGTEIERTPTDSGVYWYDVSNTEPGLTTFLTDRLGLHPIMVADAVEEGTHTARFQTSASTSLILAHGINYSVDSELIEIAELGILIGDRIVVTVHSSHLVGVEEVKSSLESGKLMALDTSALTHLILDRFVSNIRPAVDHMSDVMDELEEAAISKPIPAVLEGILRMKRSALRVNRAMQRQLEILHQLRIHFAKNDDELGLAYQDLAEKATRTFEINSVIRERSDSALAVYQGSVSLKQNETMKALAIIAAVFLPLSLLAGIYGMNFAYMPELEHRWGYHAILIAMAVFGIIVTWWVWLRPKISIWRVGTRGLYSMKVPVDLVNTGVRSVSPISKLRVRGKK